MAKILRPDSKIKVNRAPQENNQDFRVQVRHQGPWVILLIDKKPIPMSTPQAHKIGWALLREADDCIREANNGVLWAGHKANHSVIMTVNGTSLNVSAHKARQIAAALLRNSDPADDFQKNNRVKII